jgi:DNA polymerase III epsilon subunit-like protein
VKAVILDTETTGLIANHSIAIDKQPEIIEFYAHHVDLATRKITKRFDTLIRPHIWPMTDKTIAETKTKITNAELKDAPKFKDVAKDIRKICEGAPVIIAHNAAFDQEIISIEFERMKETIKWPRMLCTVEQTIQIKGYRLSLTNLHLELFGKTFGEAHRAKLDVEALTKCCIQLYKRKML